MYNVCIEVEWDPRKSASNLKKHGIRFSDVVVALSNPQGITIEDDRFDEQRFIMIGKSAEFIIVVVVYCYPSKRNTVRIISARRATPREREQYEAA